MSKKKKATPEDGRELAFRLFRKLEQCEQYPCDKDKCRQETCWLDQLSKDLNDQYGIEADRPLLNVWREIGDWDARKKRIEKRDAGDAKGGRSYEQIMFDSLIERKEAYDRFFETQGANAVDNNAQWAYNDIISKLMSLLGAMHAAELEDLTPEEAKRRLSELFNSAYGLGPCR